MRTAFRLNAQPLASISFRLSANSQHFSLSKTINIKTPAPRSFHLRPLHPSPTMADLPSTYSEPVHIAIIGGTGLGALPSPPFTPVALIPQTPTPWGLPSSPIAILSYTPPASKDNSAAPPKPTTIAFLARHGLHHQLAPHEIPVRANVAALKTLGVRTVIAFSAVGSLRTEVAPRDFCVVDQIIDWTKGVRPWTFFEDGIVGHVSMADPVDSKLSEVVASSIAADGVLVRPAEPEGSAPSSTSTAGTPPKVHPKTTLVCIEGPQFSTRAESHLYRSFNLGGDQGVAPVSVINMSAVPECKLFREAEIAYSLVCMSTDYDSWHLTEEGVSVAMVMGHMRANGANAKRAVEAILAVLGGDEKGGLREEAVVGERLKGSSRWSVMGLAAGGVHAGGDDGKAEKAVERLRWLFGDMWIAGG